MVEIAFTLVGLALAVFFVYLTIFIHKLGKTVDETNRTIKLLTTDANVSLYQVNELMAKVNVLTDDVAGKMEVINPLFVAVADLSETVSDLNSSARNLSDKAVTTGGGVRSALSRTLLSTALSGLGSKKKAGK
ncbi:DUF948 domain-containing protein [Streptococcus danieliae]|uniref:DUF948 domain-containing protein n=1 Tax=Streptococcus danieliae TaxID=747656 RepID=A0A7X3G7D1_9STRE|nr:DUF948 domain-containing protein [Streptococcus danieliae]MBF0699715.1 DUF948 domain-containing protein [Streptococcus danieliae]MBF0717719.1 DUF948 domain-containing protein [Streptococcus danieliae]MCU0082387.1 DUF948 domain-containing protein [Streptococcus danieliae]MVX58498.1 DUF948 domain-containing protein [Streptococcus danieliae]NYS49649.1 DUF948 domain-containing protein [Streptococcus danieliae]